MGIKKSSVEIDGVLNKPEDLVEKILAFSKAFSKSACRFFDKETTALDDVMNVKDLVELLGTLDGVTFRVRIDYGHFNYIWITLNGGARSNRAAQVRLSWDKGDSTEGDGPFQSLPALMNNAKSVLYSRRRQ